MKQIFTFLFIAVLGLSAASVNAQLQVVDSLDAAQDTIIWTKTDTIVLDGLIFVNEGQLLMIKEGTVIKGKPGQAESASALVVQRGSRIEAMGTAEEPIIFTAEADDLEGSVAEKANGLWGGVIMLGRATTNNATTDKAIEGIPTGESRALYGGNNDEDDSGILKYVSIRHGGTDIGEGNEINGLTLGAVGSGGEISYVEVAANKDDGVEFFGGVPRLHHILVAWCGDDSYDYDEGYRGYGQFWAAIQAVEDGDRLGEHDGGPSDNELGAPYAHPVIFNATYIGNANTGKRVITFRDFAGGEYHNSLFLNQAKGIDLEYRGSSGSSFTQWNDSSNIGLANNLFWGVGNGTPAGIFTVESEKDDAEQPIYTVPDAAKNDFAAYFSTGGNMVADPGVTAAHPAPKGDVSGPIYPGDIDDWFSKVGYKGAFKPGENWADFSLALGDFTPDPPPAGTVVVKDDGNGTGTTTWTANNTYLLDGFVFVNDGQTLTIEPGTVIKGKPGQEENASALIVARGGTIQAGGTMEEPIIFTAEADDLEGSIPDKARGLWGGLIMLSSANTNNATTDKAIEGIPTSEPRGIYGGTNDTVSSGYVTYVSIRHGGTDIGEGNEINGLTLGAVGLETEISNVEVLANKDDGVEFFGGAPRLSNILVAYCADDSYDYDEGYRGYGQFWVAIQDPEDADRLGEHDGGPSDNELGAPYAHPVIHNVTYIGRGAGAGKRVITFRDFAGGEYHNSIFVNQDKGIDIEYRGDDKGSYDQWADSMNLKLAHNIFYDVADGTASGIFKVVSELDDNDDPIYTVPGDAETAFADYFDEAGNMVSNPGVTAAHPAPKNPVGNPVYDGADSWFSKVGYKGAFKPGENWAGWTQALGSFVPDEPPAGTIVVKDDGTGVGTTTWTSNNTYLLDGFVFVNSGQVLTIEAGTVIKGKPGQEENASALIVAQGGKIQANGSKTDPIIFTAESDDLLGSVPDKARGLWGGVIMLGKATTNNATETKAIEGIPTSEPRGIYGGTDDDDNSGYLNYASIRHGGTDIGEGNEINGLTLGAVGFSTEISNVEVVANKDDGVEFFGGLPRLKNIIVAWCADDSYDYDEGFRGYGQFWVAIQDPEDADRLGEHDGGPSDNELGAPYAHPIIHNATYIGRGAGAGKRVITFRDFAGGEYHNSIFAYQDKGIDIEYRGTDKGSFDQWKDSLNLKIMNNMFWSVADTTAEGIFKVVSELDDDDQPIYTVPDSSMDQFAEYFETAGNMLDLDPGLTRDNPIPVGDVREPVYEDVDAWFSQVDYKGAFEPGKESWAWGWSMVLGTVVAEGNPFYPGTSTQDLAVASSVAIYPNPISDRAMVNFDNPLSERFSFELYDMSGRRVKQINNIDGTRFTLERGNLKSGLYIYQMIRETGGVYTQGKLMIAR